MGETENEKSSVNNAETPFLNSQIKLDSEKMSATTKSEDILGEKWDRCLSDTAIKMAGGLAMGGVFSVFLFKRRMWPVVFGTGSGFGMGYSNCQGEFNSAFKVAAQEEKKS